MMTGRFLALALPAALASWALIVAAPAAAQCRLCATPQTQRMTEDGDAAIQLEVQARLDFDQLLLLDGRGDGVARLAPDGSSSTSGALAAMSGRAMVGSVVVRGEPGRMVRVELPHTISLYGRAGGSITLNHLVSDLPSAPRLDSQGQLRFRFGGELTVSGDSDGDYRGDVPITVDYL